MPLKHTPRPPQPPSIPPPSAVRRRRSPFVPARLPLAVALLLALVPAAAAQDVSIRAFVNETTIATGDHLLYVIEVQGASLSGVRTPRPPESNDLQLVNPYPSTSRQVSIVNGAMQQRVSYQWMYRPTRPGQARLQGTAVEVDGTAYDTDTITVTVVAATPGGGQQAQPGGPSLTPDPQAQDPAAAFSGQDLFIRATPSDRSVYVGEQIIIEYALYFRRGIQLRQSRLADSWDADGFWREDLEVDFRPVPESFVENGIRYSRIVLKRAALFPTRSGSLTVEPLRIETEAFIPSRANDPLGGLFPFNRDFEVLDVSSPPVAVDVLPLPGGAPASFAGAVGSFRLSANVSRTTVDVGAPVEVSAAISGSGNLATFAAPAFTPPGTFERYDPQVTTDVNRQGTRVVGSKTFTYVLVPRANGRYELPPLVFTYFDPAAESYVTLSSDPAAVQVTGNAPEPLAGASPAEPDMPVDDIAGLMSGEVAWRDAGPQPLHARPWTFAALATPLALLGGLALFQRRREKLSTDREYARNRRAHPAARKHLKQAEALRRQDKPRAFYAEVERAVLGFIGNRLNIPERGLTRQHLHGALTGAGADEPLIADLNRLLDECDRVRFAPTSPDAQAMQTASDRAADLIAAVDRLAATRTAARAAG